MRKLVAFILLAALVGLPTCIASAASSRTPPLHFGGRSPGLEDVLLTAGDVEGIPDGPLNVAISKIDAATRLYQNPDPRLPCGRVAPNFNSSRAVEEQFSMPEVLGIEVVANLRLSQIRSLFNQYNGDLRIGCTYRSKTNTGSIETTSLVKRIPMPQLTNGALGIVSIVRNAGGTFAAYEMAISEHSIVVSILLIANNPVKTSFVVALARVVEKRLLGHLSA